MLRANRIESAWVTQLQHASGMRGRLLHAGSLAPILIGYFFLAFYHIGHQSLWVDEVISVQVASDESFFSPVIWFRQSPLYFALLHLWVQLGTSEIILRSLSVVFGGIAVCLTYLLGLRLFNQRVAWVATIMLATSPFFIWYSQEVRYITLMIAASLFSMYAFHRALDSDRRGWWFSYSLSLVVAMAAFVSNVLLPFVQGLFVLCSPSHRHLLRKVLIGQLLFFVVFIWWANGGQLSTLAGRWERLFTHITASSDKVSSLPRAERLSSGGDRDFELAAVPYTFFTFSTGFSMGPSVRELQVSRSIDLLKPYAPLLSILGLLFGGLLISGLIALWRQRDAGSLLMVWLAVPIIGASLVSAFTDMAYNVRYVSMALPAYLLILGVGISSLRRPGIQTSLLATVILVNAVALGNYYSNPRYAREDARSAAEYLESAARPQDIILVVGSTRPLRYYYKGNASIVGWRKRESSSAAWVSNVLTEITRNHERVWLVEIRPWEGDPEGKVKTTLEGSYRIIQHEHFSGIHVSSYDLKT